MTMSISRSNQRTGRLYTVEFAADMTPPPPILQRSLENYSEAQGKGFICWRFLIKEVGRVSGGGGVASASGGGGGGEDLVTSYTTKGGIKVVESPSGRGNKT